MNEEQKNELKENLEDIMLCAMRHWRETELVADEVACAQAYATGLVAIQLERIADALERLATK